MQAWTIQAEVRPITTGQSRFFFIDPADGLAAPAAVDVDRVVGSSITSAITTGIAHRRAGVGMIGAGVVQLPLAAFADAAAVMRSLAANV